MNKKLLIIAVVAVALILLSSFKTVATPQRATWWRFQSIDTMKYSRDQARQMLNDPSFDSVIDTQVKNIAATGATHVSIATPYDEEFYPTLKRWVTAARKYNLKVWFRGNWSGWEGWFDYPKITRSEHIQKTTDFIAKHSDLFEDGDVFTACPECENGGPGDPRQTGDIDGHRKFLIDEYNATKKAFKSINKNVISNFDSMNGDVARAVMDKATTSALDGVVTIDHYVATPEQLAANVQSISQESGGKIVLGEFGAPIPDINGDMTEDQQAQWINDAMSKLVGLNEVEGLSYWTNSGSSTALWNDDGSARKAVNIITSFYKAPTAHGTIKNEAGDSVGNAYLTIGNRHFFTNSKGEYSIPDFGNYSQVVINAPGFQPQTVQIDPKTNPTVVLKLENEDIIFIIRRALHNLTPIL